ncbi:hypothetical protein KBTX_02591 [wastewater metagenome]|uniref:Bacterial sugar transferase domain-containing protein n=4 Tax=root TaxID=1 RepID=A0A5B8RBT4_9ZZZZ|nr:TIGR03013 family XrtA/PEP-CTERM system glycosyltransferase [Arhodomonas aquaeolei]QEA06260.1 hypothetical protein KBTEX_02591 [uncultured organism]
MKRISSHYYYRIFLALPLLEGLVVAAALLLAGRMLTGGGDLVSGAFPAGVAGVLAVLGMTTTGLYNYRLRDRFGGVMVRALLAFAGAALLAAALYYLLLGPGLDMTVLAWSWALAFSLVLVLRAGYFRWLGAEGIKRRVLILGAGRRAQPLSRLRRRTDLLGLRVVGFVALPSDESRIVEPVRLVELDRALPEWVAANGIDEIVVALDERRRGLGGRGMDVEALLACRTQGVAVTDVASFVERETGKLQLEALDPSWLVFSPGFIAQRGSDLVKRGFDLTVSALVLLLAGPLLLLAVLAIKLEDGWHAPVLYRQARVGQGGHAFDVLKLRSMTTDAERPGEARWAQRDDPRVTRVGRVLRRYRIDELPQIWNIARGEMSFVGPRPERPAFVEQLAERLPYYRVRHVVRPGLTGWAQINYAYAASEEDAFEKLRYDLFYIKNRSLRLDLTILLQTAEAVFCGRGVR